MTNEIKINGISSLPIQSIINQLTSSYVTMIKNNVKFKDFPAVMLWSAPGVGKSQSVEQIAENIRQQTKKNVVVKDIRLLLYQPCDMRGLPIANGDKTKAIWLRPEMFELDSSEKTVNIVFLDEITACAPSLQACAYQLVLDRKIGEHELPDNTIVIAAGNRTTDKSVSYKMPKALANRFLHFDVTTSFEAWKQWAINNRINPIVLGFLNFRPDLLSSFDPNNDLMAYGSPRSWNLVSNILNLVNDNVNDVYDLICGLVGTGIASELKSWYKMYEKLPSLDSIFAGKEPTRPTESSVIFALCCALIKKAKEKDIDTRSLLNSVEYCSSFPKEFFVMIVQEFLLDNNLKSKLVEEREFMNLINKNSVLLNGSANNGYFKN